MKRNKMMHTEIYYSAEHAYNAAMYICQELQLEVTLSKGEDGEFIISWTA
jgi:hypothetical protein